MGLPLEDLAAEHGAFLLALAHAITQDWAEAEDVVQSTYEIALRNAEQLRNPGAARAWLVRIETREAFRLRRRLRRFVPLAPHVEEIRDDPDLDVSLDLRTAISELPSRTRAALVLHHCCGLSVEETAGCLGVSANTVKTQLREGLAKIREEMK